MRATWRPLPAWPYPPAPKQPKTFEVSWAKTLDELEKEIAHLGGSDVVFRIVAMESQFTLDGGLRGAGTGSFKTLHVGAEVAFDTDSRGRLIFHTDAFPTLQQNLRAISLGLTALRAIDRYGITSTEQQYAGFAMLPAGVDPADRGARLVEAAGGLTQALKAHHPDHGGKATDFADVQAYRKRAAL